MPPTAQELSSLIYPLVPEAVQHNNRILSQTHSLTAFLLGLSAGILGLQSTSGFSFYLIGTVFVSALFQTVLIRRSAAAASASTSKSGSSSGIVIPAEAGSFFIGSNGGEIEGIDRWGFVERTAVDGKTAVVTRKGAWRDVWLGGGVLGEALSGFVLGWAGVGGVLR